MLKINLLPVRLLKKRAKAKKQFTGMVLLFLAVVVFLGLAGYMQIREIDRLQAEIDALNKIKNSYTPTLLKIAKFKKQKKELDRKTQIIRNLKTESSLTVRALDEVANRIDNQRMWLTSLHQQNNSLELSGMALDNQTIAQFMDNLKASEFISDVALANSSLKTVSGRNLKNFSLNCTVFHPKTVAVEEKK